MATRTITETDCDRCEAKNVPVKTFRVTTHRVPDPAGGSSEDAGLKFDLCMKCMAGLLQRDLDGLSYEEAKKIKETINLKRTEEW